MKKYGWIIGILVVMNIVLLGIVWFGKPPHSGGQELRKFVEQNLKFTEEQSKQYDVLISEHRKRIREIDEQTKEAKQALFQLVNESADTVKEKALTEQLAKLAIEKECLYNINVELALAYNNYKSGKMVNGDIMNIGPHIQENNLNRQ